MKNGLVCQLNLFGLYSPKLASFLDVLDTPQLAAGRFIFDHKIWGAVSVMMEGVYRVGQSSG